MCVVFSIQIFHKILLQYTYAALFRDKVDGSLRGMTLLGFDRDMVEGRKCTVMKVKCSSVSVCPFSDCTGWISTV